MPDAPTHADSRSFATAFERAYQINLRIPGYRNIQVELTAPAWATTAMRGGYTVGLDARIQFGNPTTPTPPAETPATPTATPKPRPSGFFEYTVYFLVTKRFTIRGEPLDGDHERGDTPKFPDARTVACNGGEA